MKARFDVKQTPIKIIKNNGVAYVFICLNEEEKQETITYTFPVEELEQDMIEDTEEPEMMTTTVTVIYYEYDYNEFSLDANDALLDDIEQNPENYITYPIMLSEEKYKKQEENKQKLADFLDKSYVEFNGKQYGVSEEDQTEMALNYMQYQISLNSDLSATLEWHAKKEACVKFTEEDFLTLTMLIKNFVYPYINLMQEYKEKIYACSSIDELNAIELNYS